MLDESAKSKWPAIGRSAGGIAAAAVMVGGIAAWPSSPAFAASGSQGVDLGPGVTLKSNHFVTQGGFKLLMQGDGNLVLLDGTTALWASGTSSKGAYAVMQTDGNFVVYSTAGGPLWASNTAGGGGDCEIATSSMGQYSWTASYYLFTWPEFAIAPCYTGSSAANPKSAIIGDSITQAAQNALLWVGYGGLEMQISARAGLTLGQQTPAVQALMANPGGAPSRVLLELGSNDVEANNTSWQSDFNTDVTDARNTASCVILTTVNPNLPAASNGIAAAINNSINFDAYVNSADVHVLDPGWGTTVPISSDGVHPTPQGASTMGQEEAQALEQDC